MATDSIIVLDDYQNRSAAADWSVVGQVPITTMRLPISSDKLVETLKPHSIICCMRERTRFPKQVIEQLPNLRFLCTTGMRNRAIDLTACKARNVTVSGTSAQGNSSAGAVEQTWALILALARRIVTEHEATRHGEWQTGVATGLEGKTLGLVGLGRLGRQAAKIGKAFDMRVICWSPNMTHARAQEAGVEYSGSLEVLMKTADVVSLHIILSDSTTGLIGATELDWMKPSAILVNTSRGQLIDEKALLAALPNLGGVGLDVFDVEPLPGDHPLRKANNVILSPHMGYVDDTTFDSWWEQIPQNVAAFLAGKPSLPMPVKAVHVIFIATELEAAGCLGVTPATIAILGGRIKVGLSNSQLDELAEKGDQAKRDGGAKLWKVGRRELGTAVVKRVDGGTTVSGTMAVAHMTGIKVFSTGGIGGVHRGAETSFDISSDLISLADTPVAVVCAGSKSILDIGLTLEYLEAHAVPVAALGTPDWPAFYTPRSGFKAPMQLDDAKEVAKTIYMTDQLGLPSSLLLGVPIPQEYHAASDALQEAVEQAVLESVENGMSKSGKAVTPWLLGRVAELTRGSSVDSNKALIKNNVKVGGQVASELSCLLNQNQSQLTGFQPSAPTIKSTSGARPLQSRKSPLVVIGSLAIDITMRALSDDPSRTTAPGTVSLSIGGVASNVARAAYSIGVEDVKLIAPLGNDWTGDVAKRGLAESGLRDDGLLIDDARRTATCGILLDKEGDLFGGIADMDITEGMSADDVIEKLENSRPRVMCFDGNVNEHVMTEIVQHCQANHVQTFFEPTSNAKSIKSLRALASISPATDSERARVDYTTPNVHELSIMYNYVRDNSHLAQFQMGLWFDFINVSADALARSLPAWINNEGVVVMAVQLLTCFRCLLVKSGERGVVVVQRVSGPANVAQWKRLGHANGTVVAASSGGPDEAVVIRHYPSFTIDPSEIESVTGAGDNFAGALLAGLVNGHDMQVPQSLDRLVSTAQKAAIATLKSPGAVA
ncbi:hypothetical protein OIV83_000770 [Microbotryomycetes sp. JL201]|nr:hypothetical protein OIV83_000770 [Microbotryomycetes sp. JL201]